MDMREWAKEFEVVNGRKANSDEFLAAKQQGFPSTFRKTARLIICSILFF